MSILGILVPDFNLDVFRGFMYRTNILRYTAQWSLVLLLSLALYEYEYCSALDCCFVEVVVSSSDQR